MSNTQDSPLGCEEYQYASSSLIRNSCSFVVLGTIWQAKGEKPAVTKLGTPGNQIMEPSI
jgi:hypothetical protein